MNIDTDIPVSMCVYMYMCMHVCMYACISVDKGVFLRMQ